MLAKHSTMLAMIRSSNSARPLVWKDGTAYCPRQDALPICPSAEHLLPGPSLLTSISHPRPKGWPPPPHFRLSPTFSSPSSSLLLPSFPSSYPSTSASCSFSTPPTPGLVKLLHNPACFSPPHPPTPPHTESRWVDSTPHRESLSTPPFPLSHRPPHLVPSTPSSSLTSHQQYVFTQLYSSASHPTAVPPTLPPLSPLPSPLSSSQPSLSSSSLAPSPLASSPSLPPLPSLPQSSLERRSSNAAPVADPISERQLEELVELIASSQTVVAVTGAGCSTEAGVPDYRGPQGAYTKHNFKPMTHQQFIGGAEQRARYFARSFFGWDEFSSSQPAGAHLGLARLVAAGHVSHIITQNVDRLHHKAGTPSERVTELHGSTHVVQCLSCGAETPRSELQQRLAHLNPAASDLAAQLAEQQRVQKEADKLRKRGDEEVEEMPLESLASLQLGSADEVMRSRPSTQPSVPGIQVVPVRRPDGDVEMQDSGLGFKVPPCDACGGILKPWVVFFGDNIPKPRTQKSLELASQADLLLVIGSSLMVYSAFRLVEATKRAGGRVVVINIGETRADGLADAKFQVLAGEACMRLATHPRLLLPKI